MYKYNYLFFVIAVISCLQGQSQQLLTNDQALLIVKNQGYQTLNLPIFSKYEGLTDDQAVILSKLKTGSIIDYVVVDPVSLIVTTQTTETGNSHIAAQTKTGTVFKTYLAVALVEVHRVVEVRQHQTKNNAQTVDFEFKILNVSSVGNALGLFKVGSTITHTVDFINTSNGWKEDMEDRNDLSITSYTTSNYGPTGLSSYKNTLKDIDFIKGLRTKIIGKWNRYTKKEKRKEHYIFNQDGTYENYVARKDITTSGKYKFSTNYGNELLVSLIPREGRNEVIRLKRSQWGMLINGTGFEKEGAVITSATTQDNSSTGSSQLDQKRLTVLKSKQRIYSRKLTGFWKSSNGKTTMDIASDKSLTFNNKKESYESATCDIVILDNKLYLTVYDKDLLQVYQEELKVVRSDQMTLGGKIFTKF